METTQRLRVNEPSKEALHFRKIVWAFFEKNGRNALPWRHTFSPYHILVSEIMLQQTQVQRVIPYYWKFLKKFPTVQRLANAPLSDVLKVWQGLGYNRRAQKLHRAAEEIVGHYRGSFPKTAEQIALLPGVGLYTAHAVAAFAFNRDGVFIETNIRTAIIHHFFGDKEDVPDEQIMEVLEQVLPKGKAREWYSALMDYGASLKRSGISHNARSRTYTKQSPFTGSLREARGAILRELALGAASPARLVDLLGAPRRAQMRTALRALFAEGLVKKEGGNYALPD
ncbi:hypothetical protein A2950_02105 [Candidatus Kaiserbacteria bacterium RIFCSPLOWO2_01_FULL_55_19]|uniref:Adenine DNA glycosylase n=1 Tax=Candidatus Kaiserbacteria bacterium RIFCSPLOWO2_01_FULL_55_19 TaxID=1798516 RepID=A0A1F6ESB5_9BACT|nr:MAG: hypothetical protein A2950_02105 [Candidatus Kaiserbacteria bacterium RIFCSPLOWO2_01_FULL_55_19]